MTTAYERTRSIIETGGFLARISRDKTLPDHVREQARQLLRHYPTAEAVRLAGRCEAIRQDEVSKLSPRALHPALSTWPLLDPFFCDPTIHDASHPSAPPVVAGSTALQPSPRPEDGMVAASFQILGLAAPAGMGCLSIEHRCFTSARALVLSRATVVLGSPTSARN
ncbi:BPSL0761 family protein [Pseudomonas coronafaciens]|uniref:BPSL0761 family protein n=1 Tax=Pseudomonas coronafaciens TaxID=53409 RepID=UPI0009BEAD2B